MTQVSAYAHQLDHDFNFQQQIASQQYQDASIRTLSGIWEGESQSGSGSPTLWKQCRLHISHNFELTGNGTSIWQGQSVLFQIVGTVDQDCSFRFRKTHLGQFKNHIYYQGRFDWSTFSLHGQSSNGGELVLRRISPQIVKPHLQIVNHSPSPPVNAFMLSGVYEGRTWNSAQESTRWTGCYLSFSLHRDSTHGVVTGQGVSLWQHNRIPFNITGTFDVLQASAQFSKRHVLPPAFTNTVMYPNLLITMAADGSPLLSAAYQDGGGLSLKLCSRSDFLPYSTRISMHHHLDQVKVDQLPVSSDLGLSYPRTAPAPSGLSLALESHKNQPSTAEPQQLQRRSRPMSRTPPGSYTPQGSFLGPLGRTADLREPEQDSHRSRKSCPVPESPIRPVLLRRTTSDPGCASGRSSPNLPPKYPSSSPALYKTDGVQPSTGPSDCSSRQLGSFQPQPLPHQQIYDGHVIKTSHFAARPDRRHASSRETDVNDSNLQEFSRLTAALIELGIQLRPIVTQILTQRFLPAVLAEAKEYDVYFPAVAAGLVVSIVNKNPSLPPVPASSLIAARRRVWQNSEWHASGEAAALWWEVQPWGGGTSFFVHKDALQPNWHEEEEKQRIDAAKQATITRVRAKLVTDLKFNERIRLAVEECKKQVIQELEHEHGFQLRQAVPLGLPTPRDTLYNKEDLVCRLWAEIVLSRHASSDSKGLNSLCTAWNNCNMSLWGSFSDASRGVWEMAKVFLPQLSPTRDYCLSKVSADDLSTDLLLKLLQEMQTDAFELGNDSKKCLLRASAVRNTRYGHAAQPCLEAKDVKEYINQLIAVLELPNLRTQWTPPMILEQSIAELKAVQARDMTLHSSEDLLLLRDAAVRLNREVQDEFTTLQRRCPSWKAHSLSSAGASDTEISSLSAPAKAPDNKSASSKSNHKYRKLQAKLDAVHQRMPLERRIRELEGNPNRTKQQSAELSARNQQLEELNKEFPESEVSDLPPWTESKQAQASLVLPERSALIDRAEQEALNSLPTPPKTELIRISSGVIEFCAEDGAKQQKAIERFVHQQLSKLSQSDPEHVSKLSQSDTKTMAETTEEDDEDRHTCRICFLNEANSVIDPCGHALCNQCSRGMEQCPMCRAAISKTIQLFF